MHGALWMTCPSSRSVPTSQAKEVGKVLGALVVRDGNDLLRAMTLKTGRNTNIHQVRKAIRRLRNVLHLCRKTFGKTAMRVSSDLALHAGLSDLRDAHVMTETVNKLPVTRTNRTLTRLRHHLTKRRERAIRAPCIGHL